jgi:hypothetical protein
MQGEQLAHHDQPARHGEQSACHEQSACYGERLAHHDEQSARQEIWVKASWCFAFLFLSLPLVVRLVLLAATPVSGLVKVVDFIYDDGYYYLDVAANVAELGRSTLDGITATNGYQPLWMLVLAGLARIVGTEPHRFFIASCALVYAIACIAPLLAWLWRRSAGRGFALCIAAGLAVVMIQQPVTFLEGMEPILVAPLALPLVMLIERENIDVKALLLISALLAAAFLIRLDSLALFVTTAIGLPLFELLNKRLNRSNLRTRMVRVAAVLSVFVVPTVIAYLAINQRLFGTPIPVSGIAKLVGGPSLSNWGVFGMFFDRWKSFAVLMAILLPLELVTRAFVGRPVPVFYRSLAIVAAAMLLQAIYYAAFSAWNLWPWYTYLAAIATALVVARIVYLCSLVATVKRARIVALAALAVVGAWAAGRSGTLASDSLPRRTATPTSYNQISLDMLDSFFKAEDHTLIAMGDRAGGLAFWGRGKVAVVQTEGLLLDIDYFKARRANTSEQYFERMPIQYWVIDREITATVPRPDGHLQYVVPDPIQGRITTAAVPTFCFPPEAIRYQKSYTSIFGVNTRLAFSFADREPCTAAALDLMRSTAKGIGLRQFSLPTEYDRTRGGTMDKRSEDRDRHFMRD